MCTLLRLTLVLVGALLMGQSITGRISGTVTDTSGALMPGATVTILQKGTGLARTVQTNAEGFFIAANLPPGEYDLRVEAQGFQLQERRGYELTADGRLTADFRMSPGELNQTILVQDVIGDTVNVVSGEVSRVIQTEQVQNLALNARNYMQLVSLIPGAALLNEDQMELTTSLSIATQAVNGNRPNTSSLAVDGGFNQDAGSNGSQINNVGIEFIQEVKIQTSNFSAEYGRNSGASINVVTRSGTNQFHGALWHFLRNDKLDARNTFAPRQAPLRFNNFGWTLGGPIRRDRVFFLVGQEWKLIRRFTEPVRRTLPPSAFGRGDFSSAGRPIIDPLTGSPFPNGVIPASRLSPDGVAVSRVFQRMGSLASTFTDALVANNVTFQLANPFDVRQDFIRLDARINDRHSLYGRYMFDDYELIDPFGTFANSALPVTPTIRRRPGTSYQITHTWTPTARLVNEAKANAMWHRQRIPPTGDTWQRESYGFAFTKLFPNTPFPNGVPDVNVADFTSWRGPSAYHISPNTDLSLMNNTTWVAGAHTLKAGVLLAHNRQDRNAKPPFSGSITFLAAGNSQSTGYAMADAMLGNFRTYSEAEGDPVAFFRFNQFEAFAMDSWKVNRRLSVELGIRYYSMQPAFALMNNITNFDPALYNSREAVTVLPNGTLAPGSGNRFNGLIRAGEGVPAGQEARVPNATSAAVLSVPSGAPRGFYNGPHLFAPRFSFALSPTNSGRTAIRGGFGMFYDRPEGNLIAGTISTPPYLVLSQYENGNLASLTSGPRAPLTPWSRIDGIDPNLQNPYTMNFSLGVQHELQGGLFVEATYVGNLGLHLIRQPDINRPEFADLVANAQRPAAQRLAVNALRPYKGFSEIRMRLSDSTSNYHGLQLHASKRRGSLMFTGNYTFSKVLTDSSGNTDDPEDYRNRRFSYGPASFDRTHVLVVTGTYSLPLFRTLVAPLRGALGGWELSGIGRSQTGAPLTVVANTATGARRADYIGGDASLPSDQRSRALWFNTSAFTAPANDRLGTSGVGVIPGPGLSLLDLSLRKKFQMRERVTFRLQLDAFNILNQTNFRSVVLNISQPGAGSINTAGPARNLQVAAKVSF